MLRKGRRRTERNGGSSGLWWGLQSPHMATCCRLGQPSELDTLSKFHFGQAPPVINQPCVIAHTLVAPVGVAHIWDLWRRNIDLAWEQKDEIWFGLVPNIATRRLVFCFQKLLSAEKKQYLQINNLDIPWFWLGCLFTIIGLRGPIVREGGEGGELQGEGQG